MMRQQDAEALNNKKTYQEDIHLSDEVIHDIIRAEEAQNNTHILSLCADFSASDFAELLEKVNEEQTRRLAIILQDFLPAQSLAYMRHDTAKQVIEHLPHHRITQLIADLDTDDAIDLLEPFTPEEQKEILRGVAKRTRALVEEGLSYPEDSAGRLMNRDFIAIPKFWTVGKTFDYLQGLKEDLPTELYHLFVVDPMHSVVGTIQLVDLFKENRQTKIAELAVKEPHLIPATMDQEDVAYLFEQSTLISAPVVDDNERLIGVITADDIINVVQEEAEEDILRLAGVQEGDIDRPILGIVRSRFSWLAINLITSIIASLAIGFFEATLNEVVALAILMPIVASMGGNAGTQTLTVTVRALATRELSMTNAWRVIAKESLVGVINGLAFAILGGVITWVWFHDPILAVIVSSAMLMNLFVAGFAGVLIPMGLERLKIDPALASSVALTTITDIVGFVLFLGLGTYFLG